MRIRVVAVAGLEARQSESTFRGGSKHGDGYSQWDDAALVRAVQTAGTSPVPILAGDPGPRPHPRMVAIDSRAWGNNCPARAFGQMDTVSSPRRELLRRGPENCGFVGCFGLQRQVGGEPPCSDRRLSLVKLEAEPSVQDTVPRSP